MEKNEIELGILLCNQLFDEEKDGITYKEAKQSCKLLDVIELGRIKDETDAADENGDHHDPVGYDELVQVLKSFLWSNIDVDGGKYMQLLTKTFILFYYYFSTKYEARPKSMQSKWRVIV